MAISSLKTGVISPNSLLVGNTATYPPIEVLLIAAGGGGGDSSCYGYYSAGIFLL